MKLLNAGLSGPEYSNIIVSSVNCAVDYDIFGQKQKSRTTGIQMTFSGRDADIDDVVLNSDQVRALRDALSAWIKKHPCGDTPTVTMVEGTL